MRDKAPSKRPAPDLDGLRWFARTKDRELSPIFVGRTAELDRFDEIARDVLADWREGRPVGGITTVVCGCPGMGKSALLERFVETRCNQEDDPDSPLAVKLRHSILLDEDRLENELYDAARHTPWWEKMLEAAGEDVAARFKLSNVLNAVRRIDRKSPARMRPVCVVVDEVQTLKPQYEAGLTALHSGVFDLPILPLYAGLNDSIDALRSAGISRLARNAAVRLGLLSREECREAVEALFDIYQVVGAADERERWIKAISADSADFPQHLHAGMQEAGVLVERSGNLDAEGLGEARRRAAAARKAYYDSRLSPTVEDRPETLLTLIRLANGNEPPAMRSRARLVAAVLEHMRTQQETYGEPTRDDAVRYMNAVIHDGILQLGEDRGYEVPIPSMKTWLLTNYARRVDFVHTPPTRRNPCAMER